LSAPTVNSDSGLRNLKSFEVIAGSSCFSTISWPSEARSVPQQTSVGEEISWPTPISIGLFDLCVQMS